MKVLKQFLFGFAICLLIGNNAIAAEISEVKNEPGSENEGLHHVPMQFDKPTILKKQLVDKTTATKETSNNINKEEECELTSKIYEEIIKAINETFGEVVAEKLKSNLSRLVGKKLTIEQLATNIVGTLDETDEWPGRKNNDADPVTQIVMNIFYI